MSRDMLPLAERVNLDRGGDAQSVWKGEGFAPRARRQDNPQYKRDLTEAIRLVEQVYTGSRMAAMRFQEAMSSDDFPQLFADILDRQVLAKFREWPSRWQPIAKERTVRDFRNAKLFLPNTGATGEMSEVEQLAEYPEQSVAEQTPQTYSVAKYGRTIGISWETMVNDDLDMFADLPERLAKAARRTEDYTASRLYCDASGPHASLYTVGNANIVNTTNSGAAPNGEAWGINPPLTVDSLHQAMVVLSKMTDEEGEPAYIETVTLVVPPALEVPAMNILNAVQLRIGTVGQGADAAPARNTELLVQNWLQRKVRLLVNPYIPYIATSANGDSSWYLFGDPSDSDQREAIAMVFLRGYREPQLFMKAPNASQMGGSSAGEYSGDFESDANWYKIRHVLGSLRTSGGHRSTVASNGSGS